MGEGFAGRYEVLDEPGRRRSWPVEAKLRIVAESHEPGAMVSEVARRHRLLPSQVTTWRRLHRDGLLALPPSAPPLMMEAPAFVPLMLEAETGAETRPEGQADADGGLGDRIEVETGGVVVRLPGVMPVERLVAIVSALRSTAG